VIVTLTWLSKTHVNHCVRSYNHLVLEN